MIGDTIIDNGIEFEVVWSGGEGLVGGYSTKDNNLGVWTHTPRHYNKTGRHSKPQPDPQDAPDVVAPEEAELINILTET